MKIDLSDLSMPSLALCAVCAMVCATVLAGCAGPTPTETSQNANEWAAIIDAIHAGHLAADDPAETMTWEARARAAHRLAAEMHDAAGGNADDLLPVPPFETQTQPED